MVCTKKNLFKINWTILGAKIAHPHNSGLALSIFSKICRMKGANRYVEQLGKSCSTTSTFKCRGSTVTLLVSKTKIMCQKVKVVLKCEHIILWSIWNIIDFYDDFI